jgi:hypothetical protein
MSITKNYTLSSLNFDLCLLNKFFISKFYEIQIKFSNFSLLMFSIFSLFMYLYQILFNMNCFHLQTFFILLLF